MVTPRHGGGIGRVAHIGDPMRDLGWMLCHSWRFGRAHLPVGGFGQAEDFFAGYESVSGQPVDREAVKFWQVFGSFWWAVGCLGMAEHFRNGPDQSVERPGIGRRSSECQVDCVNLLIPGPVVLVSGDDDTGLVDMPRADELLSSGDIPPRAGDERNPGAYAVLSAGSQQLLEIVEREMVLAALRLWRNPALASIVQQRCRPTAKPSLSLVKQLRDGSMALETPGLADHLRGAIVNQIATTSPDTPVGHRTRGRFSANLVSLSKAKNALRRGKTPIGQRSERRQTRPNDNDRGT